MKNIVFYAHKVSFIQNWINPLAEFLNCKVYVFHINSIDNERLIESDTLSFIDIAEISTRDIMERLSQIGPDAIIFLGFRSLIELLILRICKELKIKTIYLEHGLYTKDTIVLNTLGAKRNPKYVILKYANFLTKYISFLLLTPNRFKELNILIQAFFLKKYQITKFDKALFFSEHGFHRLNSLFDYDHNQIIYCGYPLFKTKSEINDLKIESKKDITNSIIYIHQPFILNNQTSINYNEEVNYVLSLKNILENKYEKFYLLLHPRESLSKYIELYKDSGVEVIQKPNDYRIFLNKDLVIGHYSTALLYSLYFRKETIIINYPGIEIDTLFSEYCKYCNDINNLETYINSFDEIKTKPIKYLIGEENNYEHISRNIIDII